MKPADTNELRETLRILLRSGALTRIPKKPEQRDQLLGTVSSTLHRRYPYDEPALNEALKEVLATLNAQVDHVTARRYLVDFGFLMRNRDGTRYYLNFQRLAQALDEDAQSEAMPIANAELAAARERQREKAARAASYRADAP